MSSRTGSGPATTSLQLRWVVCDNERQVGEGKVGRRVESFVGHRRRALIKIKNSNSLLNYERSCRNGGQGLRLLRQERWHSEGCESVTNEVNAITRRLSRADSYSRNNFPTGFVSVNELLFRRRFVELLPLQVQFFRRNKKGIAPRNGKVVRLQLLGTRLLMACSRQKLWVLQLNIYFYVRRRAEEPFSGWMTR